MQKNLTLILSSSLIMISIIKAMIYNPGHALATIAVLCVTLAGPTFSNYRHLVKITGMDLGMVLTIANQRTLLALYLYHVPDYDFHKTTKWGQNIEALAKKNPSRGCLAVIQERITTTCAASPH